MIPYWPLIPTVTIVTIITDIFLRRLERYSTGEAKVLFHYRLPDPINKTEMGSVNCRLIVGEHLHCASTSHLIEMVANIKDWTMTHLSSTIKHIYDVTTDWKESPRNKRSWWSSGWSSYRFSTEDRFREIDPLLAEGWDRSYHAVHLYITLNSDATLFMYYTTHFGLLHCVSLLLTLCMIMHYWTYIVLLTIWFVILNVRDFSSMYCS